MARTKAAPFTEDEVVVACESVYFEHAGVEVIVHVGDRVRSSHVAVKRYPAYFVRDGMPLIPPERPEPEPEKPTTRPAKKYRVKKSGLVRGVGGAVQFTKGETISEASMLYRMLPQEGRDEFLEEPAS